MNHDETMVYSKSLQTVGYLGGVNYIDEEVLLIDDDGKAHKLELNEDAILIHKIASEGEFALYNYDVFHGDKSDTYFEVELSNFGRLQFYAVDKEMNRLHTVDTYAIDEFMRIIMGKKSAFKLIENRYTLLIDLHEMQADMKAEQAEAKAAEEKQNFNVKIIRKPDSDGTLHYYYACRNKADGTVDVIKVIFMGHHLLTEEDHLRITMPLADFLEYDFEEVSPTDLYIHVMNKITAENACTCTDKDACSDCPQETAETDDPPKDYSEGEAEADGENTDEAEAAYCEECDFPEEECECELWKK